jgi:1-acyl-sn-glycerol-3-phosphate acyltransferase
MTDKKYTFWQHGVYVSLIRFFVGPFFKLYYRFKAPSIKIKKTGPYLILANHTAEFDIVFLGMLFDAPLYFVASDQLLNSGKGSWVLKTLFNPIPKSKSIADLAVVRRMKSVLNEGGNVAIFPEGNSSMNGGPSSIPEGMGRLIKFLNVPVKFMSIQGLYLSSPRWSYHRKFGPSTMKEIKTITPNQFQSMTTESLETLVKETLHISAYDNHPHAYRGKRMAEGLHKLIFTCPQCQGLFTTDSRHDELFCHQCNFKGTYDQHGFLTVNGQKETLIMHDAMNLQRFHHHMLKHEKTVSIERLCEVAFWEGGDVKRTAFEEAIFQISEKGVKLLLKDKSLEYTYREIYSQAIQVRSKLLIYPTKGPMMLLRFQRNDSPYAILNLIKWYKNNLMEENKHEFIHRRATTFLGL